MHNTGDFKIPRVGVSACVWRGAQVLLVTRMKPPVIGLWSFPGGHVEWGETLREAAARELKEEANIDARLDRLLDCRDVIRRDAAGAVEMHYAIAVFTGPWVSGEALAGDDAGEARWFAPKELAGLPMIPGTEGLVAMSARLLDRLH